MQLNVIGDKKSKVELSANVFEQQFNEPLIHQAVTAFLAGGRQGSKAQKTRAEVSGGGKKPWRQKGTGRARAGSIRSPIWRSGGRAFAAKPRDFTQKINKKMLKGALRSILSELIRQERLVVVNDLAIAEPKTKLLKETLNKYELSNVLIVVNELTENLYFAARNLINVDAIDTMEVNPVALISFEKVLITVPALKQLEERLA